MPGNAANRTGGAGDDYSVAGFRRADVEQGEIGGHAGHAQCRQIARQGGQIRVDLVETGRLAEKIVLHAEGAVHIVADRKIRVSGGNNLADAQCTHDLAETDRRDIRLAFVHPAAHGRVQRQVFDFHQDLAFGRRAHGLFAKGEVCPGDGAHRALGEEKLTVGLGSHRTLSREGIKQC
ncbi:hypothetical protein D3C76_793450 [compost metagenome]